MLLGISFAMIFKNKRLIERKHFFTFIVFSSIPVACAIIQYFIYGISLIFNGVFLSVFILFIYVQVQDIYTDYLTGVANRKSLEICLRKKILSSSSENTFSAIMLDVDNFKKVNDTYGHKTGDTILKNIAAMMRKCIGDDGLIARYGGDEFCIVLDTADPRKLDCIVDKLKKCVDCFNAENNFHFSFNLGVSMGYAIYKHGMSLDDFQNNIDSLMYSHKRNGT
jgi:diguanylate cyclase (GGDEF)-like protein